MRIKLLVLILFVISINAKAQNDNRLLLHSGAMQTPTNVESFISDSPVAVEEIFNGYYYRIIQFNGIPTAVEKAHILESGLVLMDYIPNNAFITAIPQLFDKSLLKQLNVHSVVKLDKIQKVNQQLLGDVPAYAKTKQGFTDLVIQYHSNIPFSKIEEVCRNYEKLGANATNHTITCRLPEQEIIQLAAQPWVSFVTPAGVTSYPDDLRGRNLHRSNVISSEYATGRHYDGSGVAVGLADDGDVGPHIDFQGRLTNHMGTAGGNHGDLTAGIFVGAGNLDPTVQGMAPGADIHVYDITGYPQIVNAQQNFNTLGIAITSTSFSQTACNQYTTETQLADQLAHQNGYLNFVFSAGNAGLTDCGYGAGAGWGNITGGYKQGKNVITVGSVNTSDTIENTSSRGPASDGRIKPDICAYGPGERSTDANNTYQTVNTNGTSSACPGVAGVCAQLYQAYKNLHSGANPEASLIKACILNGAEDLGNAGPDFTYGWGRVNALRSLKTIEDGRFIKDSISQGQSKTFPITVPAGVSEIRVMIYWNDVEGAPLASKALVNNLNMHLSDPINFNWNPWVLNPFPNVDSLSAPAVRGTDTLNNVEQVTVPAGFQGTWNIHVDGASIPSGPQTFYIVYEFRTQAITVTYPNGGEGVVAGTQEVVRWDAVKGLGAFTLDYTINGGLSWINISTTINQNVNEYTWTVPATVTGQACIRVSRSTNTDVSDSLFAIVNVPQNLHVDYACSNSVNLAWNAVTGVTGYTIYKLGNKYMEEIGTSNTNSFLVNGVASTDTIWFSVASNVTGAKGRRAIAIQKLPGVFSCPVTSDASVYAIISPRAGNFSDCQGGAAIPVTVTVKNSGLNNIDHFPVSYSVNGGTVVTDTISDTLTSQQTMNYTFLATVNYAVPGTYNLKAWTSLMGDLLASNDTLSVATIVSAAIIANVPFIKDFESETTCPTTTNCGATVCPLMDGWVNETNGVIDSIDFRVNIGGTPTNNTGPDFDHTLATPQGKYIYLEASQCFGQLAELVSPCIDLTNVGGPLFKFWYHMFGATMGELHLDLSSNGTWTNDVMTPIVGDHGNTWFLNTVDLSAYSGQIINVRFRSITGTGPQSDIALDDIGIVDTHVPPVPAFSADRISVCVNSTVQFTDKSTLSPTSWRWTFNPNNVVFVNATSDTSQNPQVQFTATGLYDVQLLASNSYGDDSVSISQYIDVIAPTTTPLLEGFQGAAWPPASWRVESAGNNNTWQKSTNITGSAGIPTDASMMNNFTYNTPGGSDGLARLEINLAGTGHPVMFFDLAYAGRNAGPGGTVYDALRIDVSTDCGSTYTPTSYFKQGAALATAPTAFNAFVPNAAGQWRNDTLDLTAYVGQVVTLKFVNISSGGNNLYLDNINIIETNVAPAPAFSANYTSACVNTTIKLTDKSSFNPTSWKWSFMPNTVVFVNGTADITQNPQVQFTATGIYDIKLIATNAYGSDSVTTTQYINIITPSTITLTEDFQGASWPPVGWRVESAGNNTTWQKALNVIGSGGTPTNASWMDNFTYNTLSGQDGLARLEVSLTGTTHPIMTFDVAHRRRNAGGGGVSDDTLRIYISTDCGNTYIPTPYLKHGATLATGTNTFNPFIPNAANQWRNDTLDLTTWIGQVVTLKFLNISNRGNNVYLDNINISDFSGVGEVNGGLYFTIYPNPSDNGLFNVVATANNKHEAMILVTDINGRLIQQKSIQAINNSFNTVVDLKLQSGGTYFMEIKTADGISRYKLIKM